MIKRRNPAWLLALAVSLIFASCASTPEPESQGGEETPAVEQSAEESSNAGDEQSKNYSDANKALLDQIEQSRKAAVDAGASGDELAAVDKLYEEQKAKIQSGSSEDLSAALKDINARYAALELMANVQSAKDKIDELELASYDTKSYDRGCASLEEAKNLLPSLGESESPAALVAKAKEAQDAFNKVLDVAFRAKANAQRQEALKAKKLADEVKASVSRKADYDKGVDAYRNANTCYVTNDPEGSYYNYLKATQVFQSLYEEIYERRMKVQSKVDAAKQRVQESEAVAVEADEDSPIVEDEVDGIEEEDTQLLDDDDFTEAQSTVVELEGESELDEESASDEAVEDNL